MTQETLREAVARIIAAELGDDFDAAFVGKAAWISARGYSGGRFRDVNEPFQRDYLDAADAAIATMFEHLRTPSEKALRAGCNKIDWERNPQEHMPTAPNGIVDLNSTFLTPGATTIGQDMLDAWQAMLTAFQQENSDAANN